MTSKVERCCANPECEKIGVHLCAGCGEEIYCSKSCQKTHWLAHKAQCQNALRPKATVSTTQSFDSLSIKQLKNVLKAKAGSFDRVKREKILDQLENIVEKPALVNFVSEYVKIAEVETLLAVPESSSKAASATGSGSGLSTGKAKKDKDREREVKKQNMQGVQGHGGQHVPSPEQMRQQAAIMRKDPDLVRRQNPALANFTNQQIIDYANQMEQASRDPAMLAEIAKMSRMEPAQRDRLQHLQEGFMGQRPMDAAWIDETVETLTKHSKMVKDMLRGRGAMIGNFTDEQMEGFLDGVGSLAPGTLRWIIVAIIYLSSFYKPAVEWYKYLDRVTLGLAQYIIGALMLFVLYLWGCAAWYVLRWLYRLVFVAKAATVAGAASGAGTAASTASVANSLAESLSGAVTNAGASTVDLGGNIGGAADDF